MATPFETFVNAELPKRLSYNGFSATAGKIPRFTGAGLAVEEASVEPYGDNVLIVGSSASATHTSVVTAMEEARTDGVTTKIMVEPGTYMETGKLVNDISKDRFKGIQGTDQQNVPVIMFLGTTESSCIVIDDVATGNPAQMSLTNLTIVAISPNPTGSEFNLLSIESTSVINTIRLDRTSLSIVNAAGNKDVHVIGRPGSLSATSSFPQIYLKNDSGLGLREGTNVNPTGTTSLIDIPYDNSHSEEAGSTLLDAEESTLSLTVDGANNDALVVNFPFCQTLNIKRAVLKGLGRSSNPAPTNLKFILVDTDEVRIDSVDSVYTAIDESATTTTNPENIIIFDAYSADADSYIKTRGNKFFPYPGTVSNTISTNLANSMGVQHVLDEVCDDFTTYTEGTLGDSSINPITSVFENSGKLLLSTGATPLMPENVFKVGNDPDWADFTNLADALDYCTTQAAIERRQFKIVLGRGNIELTRPVQLEADVYIVGQGISSRTTSGGEESHLTRLTFRPNIGEYGIYIPPGPGSVPWVLTITDVTLVGTTRTTEGGTTYDLTDFDCFRTYQAYLTMRNTYIWWEDIRIGASDDAAMYLIRATASGSNIDLQNVTQIYSLLVHSYDYTVPRSMIRFESGTHVVLNMVNCSWYMNWLIGSFTNADAYIIDNESIDDDTSNFNIKYNNFSARVQAATTTDIVAIKWTESPIAGYAYRNYFSGNSFTAYTSSGTMLGKQVFLEIATNPNHAGQVTSQGNVLSGNGTITTDVMFRVAATATINSTGDSLPSGGTLNDGAGSVNLRDSYLPAVPGYWSGDPETVQDAIDRIAAAVYALQSNTPIA